MGFTNARERDAVNRPEEPMSRPCAVCGADVLPVMDGLRDLRSPLTSSFVLGECVSCGTGQLCPQPTVAELSLAYPESYFWFKDTKDASTRRVRELVEGALDVL